MTQRDDPSVLDRLVGWSENQEPVRLAFLTSTRANDSMRTDILSDYDVELVVSDLAPYIESKAWLSDFGDLLVFVGEKRLEDGLPRHIYMAIYEDGTKIDFQVYPTTLFRRYKEAPALPGRLDVGY